MDGEIGHLRESLTFPRLSDVKLAKRPLAKKDELCFGGELIPPMVEFGEGRHIHVTGSTHKETGMRDVESQDVHERLVSRIYNKIDANRDKITRVEKKHMKNAKIGLVCYGATARPTLGAVKKARKKKIKAGYLRLITIWPFPKKDIIALGEQVDHIIVPEMNLGQVSREIERFVDCDVIPVPKIGGIVHSIDEIYSKIEEVG
jgi:2-oxoglutarate ferredoxin oxidoreductase subunit alpha